jgi:hypothetical protein
MINFNVWFRTYRLKILQSIRTSIWIFRWKVTSDAATRTIRQIIIDSKVSIQIWTPTFLVLLRIKRNLHWINDIIRMPQILSSNPRKFSALIQFGIQAFHAKTRVFSIFKPRTDSREVVVRSHQRKQLFNFQRFARTQPEGSENAKVQVPANWRGRSRPSGETPSPIPLTGRS